MSMDKNVDKVCQAFQDRAWLGYKKYGCTTEREDIDLAGWLQHLQEELMDAVIYIERIKHETQQNSKEPRLEEGLHPQAAQWFDPIVPSGKNLLELRGSSLRIAEADAEANVWLYKRYACPNVRDEQCMD